MLYQDLNCLLADLAGVSESAICKDTDIGVLNLKEKDYEKMASALGKEMLKDPDPDYVKCLQSVGDLLGYVNGE